MASVIFRYSVTPSYGCCGDSDGGFALTLTDGGDVEYMEYKFCKITESCRHFDLSPNAAAEIGSIISENNARLDDIPHKLENGSFDGDIFDISFGSRKYCGLNISMTDLARLKKRRPSYYEANKNAIENVNFIAELTGRILGIIINEIPEL